MFLNEMQHMGTVRNCFIALISYVHVLLPFVPLFLDPI